MVDSFWWVAEKYPLDTVLMGISFHLYNKLNRRFWVEETLSRKKNVFAYAFNRFTFSASFLTLKSLVNPENTGNNIPLTKEEFWDFQLNFISKKYLGKYLYPDNYYHELKEISAFCNSNNIKIIIWIPPYWSGFRNKITEYRLDLENEHFLQDMISLGEVYNYDYDSEFSSNVQNFTDPLHFNENITPGIVNELLSNKPGLSRHYNGHPLAKNTP